MFRKTTVMLLVVALVLLGSTVVLAQEYWAWNQFNTAGEKFKYEIVIQVYSGTIMREGSIGKKPSSIKQ